MNKKTVSVVGVIGGISIIAGVLIGNTLFQKSQEEMKVYEKVLGNSSDNNNTFNYDSPVAQSIIRQECMSQIERLGVAPSEENIDTCMKIAVEVYEGRR